MIFEQRYWFKLLPQTQKISIFTYRHPMEVAHSLLTRNQIKLSFGLRLWIVHNRLGFHFISIDYLKLSAIKHAISDSCIVRTSNSALLTNPKREIKKIADSLSQECGVVLPSQSIKLFYLADQLISQPIVMPRLTGSLTQMSTTTHTEREMVLRNLKIMLFLCVWEIRMCEGDGRCDGPSRVECWRGSSCLQGSNEV